MSSDCNMLIDDIIVEIYSTLKSMARSPGPDDFILEFLSLSGNLWVLNLDFIMQFCSSSQISMCS